MPDCEHCGASFDDEEALLEHMGDEHWDDLGRIDRRRVESHRGGGGGLSRTTLAVGGLVLFVAAVLVFVTVFLNTGDGGIESEPLPDAGDQAVIANVTEEPGQSREHVPAGTDVDHDRLPPTGGPHYNDWVNGGFYEESPPVGQLVHSLEHGAVVVWYEPSAMTPEAQDSLRALGRAHQADFGSVIAVPTPAENQSAPFVLTAWERRLPMEEYDVETVRQFAAEYLGRGPERQIR